MCKVSKLCQSRITYQQMSLSNVSKLNNFLIHSSEICQKMAQPPTRFAEELQSQHRRLSYDRTMSLDNIGHTDTGGERKRSLDIRGLSVDQLSPQHLWAHGQHMLQSSRSRPSTKGHSQGQMKGRIIYRRFLVLSSIKRRSWPSLSPSRHG